MTDKKYGRRLLAVLLALVTALSVFGICASAASAIKISKATATYTKSFYCTGKAIKPSITLKYNGKTLTKGTDYSLSYSSNTNPGTATITVTGKGKYTGTKTCSFFILLSKPQNLKATSLSSTSVKLKWSKVTGAKGYYVYSYNATTKKYSKLAAVSSNYKTVSVTVGKSYRYAVKAYYSKVTSAYSAKVKVVPAPATPTLKCSAVDTTSVSFSWKKVTGAVGYKLYSYDIETGEYITVATIRDASVLNYAKTGLDTEELYRYSIAAWTTVDGKNYFSSKSEPITVATCPGQVQGLEVTETDIDSISLQWDEAAGATCYRVYKYDSAMQRYVQLETVYDTIYTAGDLSDNTSYKFKVAAIKETDNATILGESSEYIKATTEKINYLNNFLEIVGSNRFSINYVTAVDNSDVTMTVSVNGKLASTQYSVTDKITSSIKATFNSKSIYNSNLKSGTLYNYMDESTSRFAYVLAKLMGESTKTYETFNDIQAEENGFDGDSIIARFAPEMEEGTEVREGMASILGKSCYTYSYDTADGGRIIYYFNGSQLAYVSNGSEFMKISSYSTSVATDAFTAPDGYPDGYTESNLL